MAFLLINSLFTLLIFSSIISLVDAGTLGITVDLIHRDSPLSPYYIPNETQFERLQNAFNRSYARKASLLFRTSSTSNADSNSLIQAPILYSYGEYLMKFSVGSPPVEILALADTGSDLLWTECVPCPNCSPQSAQPFDPTKSTSYKDLSCESQPCSALGVQRSTCGSANNCIYLYSYGDKSYTTGDLAVENLTLQSDSGESVSFSSVAFGCSHDNQVTFRAPATGIIGLGAGALSIVSQLSESIGGKFSYCLQSGESNAPSKISFGSNAVVSGPNVMSTPLIRTSPYYYLSLEGVTVGSNQLDYKTVKNSTFDSVSANSGLDQNQGNIIIDSGTTLTFLPQQFYPQVESALKQTIKEQPVDDPQGQGHLCYQINGEYIDAPKIVFHFTNADIELPSTSTFRE